MALRLIGISLLTAFAMALTGCASDESGDEGEDELGAEDSGKVVSTSQTDLLLYQGFNTAFDQGHSSCVTFPNDTTVQVGDVGVDVRITHVKSREDLARELGFETDLAFKLPKTWVDARASVMNGFKRSSTTTTLLVRVGGYYFVDAGQNFKLTSEASALLRSDPRGFLQRCGDAVVTRLQYRAEVLGLMKFDTNDQETATKAAGGAGVQAPSVGTVAEANAKVSGTYNKMKQSTKSSMALELYTQGFTPDGQVSLEGLNGDQALPRLQQLIQKMAESIRADRERDVKAIQEGKIPLLRPSENAEQVAGARRVVERKARLGALSFHLYGKGENASTSAVTKMTQDANRFLLEVGDVQGRIENAYYEEVNAFLKATDQESYNLVSGPKATVAELEPTAQKWAGLLSPRPGERGVLSQLRDATLNCVRLGMSGDMSGCRKTEAIDKLVKDGNALLEKYNAEGRIVRMNLLYGPPGEVVVDKAKAACAASGGRLPYDTDMQWLKPALAAKGGFTWVMTNKCPKNIGIYTGATEPKCYEGMYIDWYDNVLDATGLSQRAAPVFCVSNSGPKGALSRPGE